MNTGIYDEYGNEFDVNQKGISTLCALKKLWEYRATESKTPEQKADCLKRAKMYQSTISILMFAINEQWDLLQEFEEGRGDLINPLFPRRHLKEKNED